MARKKRRNLASSKDIRDQKTPVAGLQVYFANIALDVLVEDLLQTARASQIFTVFGQRDVAVKRKTQDGRWLLLGSREYEEVLEKNAFAKESEWQVDLRGVDIYNPLTGEIHSTCGEDVAAWFLDADCDDMTFKISRPSSPVIPEPGNSSSGPSRPPSLLRSLNRCAALAPSAYKAQRVPTHRRESD